MEILTYGSVGGAASNRRFNPEVDLANDVGFATFSGLPRKIVVSLKIV